MRKIKQAVFQARNFFLSSISRAEILIDRKRSKSMSQAGFDVTRYSSRRASIPIASGFWHSNLRQIECERKSMAATEDGFLFKESRSCTQFSRQRWILRLVTSFRMVDRSFGLVVSRSQGVVRRFSSVFLFYYFFFDNFRKEVIFPSYSISKAYRDVTQEQEERARPCSVTDRLRWNNRNELELFTFPFSPRFSSLPQSIERLGISLLLCLHYYNQRPPT